MPRSRESILAPRVEASKGAPRLLSARQRSLLKIKAEEAQRAMPQDQPAPPPVLESTSDTAVAGGEPGSTSVQPQPDCGMQPYRSRHGGTYVFVPENVANQRLINLDGPIDTSLGKRRHRKKTPDVLLEPSIPASHGTDKDAGVAVVSVKPEVPKQQLNRRTSADGGPRRRAASEVHRVREPSPGRKTHHVASSESRAVSQSEDVTPVSQKHRGSLSTIAEAPSPTARKAVTTAACGERRRRQTTHNTPTRTSWVEPKCRMSAPVVAVSSPLAGPKKSGGSRVKSREGTQSILGKNGVSTPVEHRDAVIHVPVALNDRVLARYLDGMATPATVVENPRECGGGLRYKVRFDDGYTLTVRHVQPLEEYFRLDAGRQVRDDVNKIRCSCDINSDVGFMIQCDRCVTWQHGQCVGVSIDSVPTRYLCALCEAVEGNTSPVKNWKQKWGKIKDGQPLPWLPFIDTLNMEERSISNRVSDSHKELLVNHRKLERGLVATGISVAAVIEEACGEPLLEANMERWLQTMETNQRSTAMMLEQHAAACRDTEKMFTTAFPT